MLHFCYQITDFSLLASPFNTLLDARKALKIRGFSAFFTMERHNIRVQKSVQLSYKLLQF